MITYSFFYVFNFKSWQDYIVGKYFSQQTHTQTGTGENPYKCTNFIPSFNSSS